MFLAFLLSLARRTPWLLLSSQASQPSASHLPFWSLAPHAWSNVLLDDTISSALHLAIHGHRDLSACLALFLWWGWCYDSLFIILMGCALTAFISVAIWQKLGHYINLHYSIWVYISLLSLLLAWFNSTLWIQEKIALTAVWRELIKARQISIHCCHHPLDWSCLSKQ